jgi:hypothetical protein
MSASETPDPIQQFIDATLALGKHMRDRMMDPKLSSKQAAELLADAGTAAVAAIIAMRVETEKLPLFRLLLALSPTEGDSIGSRAGRMLNELDRYARAAAATASPEVQRTLAAELAREGDLGAAEAIARATEAGKVVGNA